MTGQISSQAPRIKTKTPFQVLVTERFKEKLNNPALAALESMRVMYAPGEIIADVMTLHEGDELPKKLAEAFVEIAASWEWMARQMALPVAEVLQERLGPHNSGDVVSAEKTAAASSSGNGEEQSPLLEESAAEVIEPNRLANELLRMMDKDPLAVVQAMGYVGMKLQEREAKDAAEQLDQKEFNDSPENAQTPAQSEENTLRVVKGAEEESNVQETGSEV